MRSIVKLRFYKFMANVVIDSYFLRVYNEIIK